MQLRSLLAVALLAICPPLFAAPGDLDPAFGTGGIINPRIGPSIDSAYELLRQSDGKLVAVGTTLSGARTDIAIARFLVDGTLDTTFGTAGRARAARTEGITFAGARLQADGRIVVSSSCIDPANAATSSLCLRRFTSDGSSDSSFGSSGTTILSGRSGGALEVLANDSILVEITIDGGQLGVARLTAAGALDATFGLGGYGITTFQSTAPVGIALQPDGRIVVTGENFNSEYHVARFLSNGAIDTSFGPAGQGKVIIPGPGSQLKTKAVGLQADGKILISGCDPFLGILVLRLGTDGAPDASFGNSGVAKVAAPRAYCGATVRAEAGGRIVVAVANANDVAPFGVQPDLRFRLIALDAAGAPDATFPGGGNLALPGSNLTADVSRTFVARTGGGYVIAGDSLADFAIKVVDASGTLDPAFGSGGTATAEFMSGRDGTLLGARAMADGRIVAVANFSQASLGIAAPLDHIGLARFNADGSFDATFGQGGQATGTLTPQPAITDFYLMPNEARAFAVRSDGKIVVAGLGHFGANETGAIVMRFNENGSLDTGFGDNGRRLIAFQANDATAANAVAILADGTAVVAGTAAPASSANQDYFVARFDYNGAPDLAFGPAGAKRFAMGVDADEALDIAAMPDNRVVVGGASQVPGGETYSALRLLSNGTTDASFGFSGAVLGADLMTATRIRVQGDGRVLIGAFSANSNGNCGGGNTRPGMQSTVVRLTVDGQLDSTFGTNGRFDTRFGTPQTELDVMALAASGRVIVGGPRFSEECRPFIGSSVPSGSYIGWLTSSGTVDTAFGTGGAVALPFPTVPGALVPLPRDLDLQSDGKILVAGDGPGANGPFFVMRLDGGPNAAPGDLDGDGIPDSIEPTVSRNALVKDNDVFGDARLFAMQQYRDFLGREGDAGGVDFWTAQVQGSTPRANVIESFYNSPEFQGVGAPVARLYFGFFRRVPDYAGLIFQMNTLRAGTPLTAVANNFSLSPEFAGTYGALDNAQYVALLYQNILGRTAAQAEIDYHVNRLAAGATRGEVAAGFTESPEFVARVANDVFVTMMYAGMLRRAPEQAGLDFWTSYMDAGNSGLALINGFLASQEYHDRFLP